MSTIEDYKATFRQGILLFIISVIFSHSSLSQNSKIDSLTALLKISSEDSNKVHILNSLSNQFRQSKDPKALVYGQEAYQLSEKIDFARGKGESLTAIAKYYRRHNDLEKSIIHFQKALKTFEEIGSESDIAENLKQIGIVYLQQSKHSEAILFFNKALLKYKKLNNNEEIANITVNLGIVYEGMGDYSKALNYYFAGLKIDEALNYKEGQAGDFNSIAVIYKKQGDLEKAIEFHQKAVALCKEIRNDFELASTYTNMGPVYKEMGKPEKALEVLDEALIIFRKQDESRGATVALHNIGSVYLKQKKYRLAADYFNQSMQMATDLSGKREMISNFISLADAYSHLNKSDSAIIIAQQGLKIAEEINSLEDLYNLNRVLYNTYKLKKDYKEALDYLEKYLANKDSLFSKEKTAHSKELQTKYETEKKEQQIQLLNKEKTLQLTNIKNKALLQNILIGVILIILVFAVIIIITNKKRQESKRLLLSEQLKNEQIEAGRLQELDQLKSRFFANIAHEFRTPLTLISGPVDNLLEEENTPYHQDQLLLVKNNSTRLLRLINQLLDLSKLESGVIKLELSKENIIGFLKGLTFSFQSLADEKDVTLEFQSFTDELFMDFDKDKVEKIVFNLLSNAFKFTPNLGVVKVSVNEIIHNENRFTEISVLDTGVGIPNDQLSLVFNRFYQADNTQIRNAEGNGIGLALTKELVEMHGGSIKVESIQGNFTLFSFTLPVKNESGVKVCPSSSTLNTIDTLVSTTKLPEVSEADMNATDKTEIVLVIEDNSEVQKFIINSLRPYYHVIASPNGDEGISLANDTIPDLILTDVMMPGKSGYETCRILKTDEKTSHIPIIMLTAKAGFESKIEGLETGADDYLAKPFNTRELLVRIKNLISTRKNLREKYLDSALLEEKTPDVPKIENAFLTKLRKVIEDHLSEEEFSIEDLSREIGMSRTQVHRKLKALTNQSASQFMRMIRLQHGRILLQKGSFNVSEVAYMVGFSAPTYFSTCYNNFFGHAPSEEIEGNGKKDISNNRYA